MSTIVVSNITELTQALASANGGDTILLEEGNYGELSLTKQSGFDYSYSDTVTIASADPNKPAVFSAMDVRDAKNLTFDGVVFDYTFAAGDEIFYRPFNFTNAENLTIRNSVFDGDLAQGVSETADGFGYAIGLSVRDSAGVVIENNEFFEFYRGMAISDGADIAVSGNEVHSIRMDGMNFSQITDIVIEDNYIHSFRGSLESNDHSDMIQFWTNGTDAPSTGILIQNNVLDIADGTPTQSIFMRNDQVDRGLAGEEMYYRDVAIVNNVIVNGHSHGITVGETDGLVIKSNSVLHDDGWAPDGMDPMVEIPRINVTEASTNVSILQNATFAINGWQGQDGWYVAQNAMIQDQDSAKPGYYGDVFISSTLQMTNGQHSFVAAPDSVLQSLGAGAPATLQLSTDQPVEAHFSIEEHPESASTRIFDAGVSMSELGSLPAGSTFVWSFGDGTTAVGQRVEHQFASGDRYDVALTVTLPNGQRDTITAPVDVTGAGLLSFQSGQSLVASDAATHLALAADGIENGIELGGRGVALAVDYEHIGRLMQVDEFSIAMTMNAADNANGGEILRIHGSLVVFADDAGGLVVQAYQADDTEIELRSSGAQMNSSADRDVEIALLNGKLLLKIDGEIAAQADFSGELRDLGARDLTFGNPWDRDNFEGTISELNITTNASAYTDVAPVLPSLVSQLIPDEGMALDFMVLDAEPEPASSPKPEPASVPEPTSTVIAPPAPNVEVNDPIDLGGTGIVAAVERGQVGILPDADNFSIDMTLSAGSEGSWGEIFRLHGSFVAEVQEDGHLRLRVFSEEGETIRMLSDDPLFEDQASHRIQVGLSDDVLHLTVDDNASILTPMVGNLGDYSNHDLVFGNPWGRQNFDGQVDAFSVTSRPEGEANDVVIDVTALAEYFGPTQDEDGVIAEIATPDGTKPVGTIPGMTVAKDVSDFQKTDADGMAYTSYLIDRFEQGANENGPFWVTESS